MWSNLDKSDKKFLGISIGIGVLLIIVLINLLNSKDLSLINIISIIGTIVTVIALIFSIHQQSKLRQTAKEIQIASNNLYASLKKDIDGWNYNKAIEIITEIENCFNNKDAKSSRPLYKYLMDIMNECNRVYFTDFEREIKEKFKNQDSITKLEYEELRAVQSGNQLIELKNAMKGCSRQYLDICKFINEQKSQSQVALKIDSIHKLRIELTKCKPPFLKDL